MKPPSVHMPVTSRLLAWPVLCFVAVATAAMSLSVYALDPIAVLLPPDAAEGFGGDFGRSVAISGDWIAVGAPKDNLRADESGAVYVFRRNGASWVFHVKLKGIINQMDHMGYSVAMDGDWLLAGAPNLPSMPQVGGAGLGRAYLFARDDRGTPDDLGDDTWRTAAVLNPPPSHLCCNFGIVVDIAGSVAVVGRVSGEQEVGSAYAFRWNGSEWLPDGVLIGNDTAEGDLFGWSVATNGSEILVGAAWDDDAGDESGSAYIFRIVENEWVQWIKLLAPDAHPNGVFGVSIAAEQACAVISGAGSAHVLCADEGVWFHQAILLPPDGLPAGAFGSASAKNADIVLVGAPSASNDGLLHAGLTHLFRYHNGSWHQEERLTASIEAPSGFLGWSVDVDGDSAVSGSLGRARVHRVCIGCGTLQEFARFQRCAGATASASVPICDSLDFDGDGAIALPDLAQLNSVLVGP